MWPTDHIFSSYLLQRRVAIGDAHVERQATGNEAATATTRTRVRLHEQSAVPVGSVDKTTRRRSILYSTRWAVAGEEAEHVCGLSAGGEPISAPSLNDRSIDNVR